MTDDQHHGAPGTPGAWQPISSGDYEDATGFVELPEGLADGYDDSVSPLAAPGHGYVPPQIDVTADAGGAADPTGAGGWAVSGTAPGEPGHDGAPGTLHPGGDQPATASSLQPGPVHWPDPNALPLQDVHHPGDQGMAGALQDPYGHDPGMTQVPGADGSGGPWHFGDEHHDTGHGTGHGDGSGGEPATGADEPGSWSIPLAQDDLPDETGEFTTSVLAAQWGGVPPTTLPGGATAPWAVDTGAGAQWDAAAQNAPAQQDEPSQARRMQQGVRAQRVVRQEYPAAYQDESGQPVGYHDQHGQPAVHPLHEQFQDGPAEPGRFQDEVQEPSFPRSFQGQQFRDPAAGERPFEERPFDEHPYEERSFQDRPFDDQTFQDQPFQEPGSHGRERAQAPYPPDGFPAGTHGADAAGQGYAETGAEPGPAGDAGMDTAQTPASPAAHAEPAAGAHSQGAPHGGSALDAEDIYVGPAPGVAPLPDTGPDAGPHGFDAAQPRAPHKRRPARRPLQDTRVQEPLPEELPDGSAPHPAPGTRPARAGEGPEQTHAVEDHPGQDVPGTEASSQPAPAPHGERPAEAVPQEAGPGPQDTGPGTAGAEPGAADGPPVPETPDHAAPEPTGTASSENGSAPAPQETLADPETSTETPGDPSADDAATGAQDESPQDRPEESEPLPDEPSAHPDQAPQAAPGEPEAQHDGDVRDVHELRDHAGEDAPFAHDEHPFGSYVLRVNGTDRPVTDAWIGESLLYVLRERLGLAGAKDGCSQGECGACNVQVDGRLVASCLVPAATTAGSDVRTVEGLAEDGQPSDVQRALAECGAVQCGFCVPGMAMTVHHLLDGNPDPTDLEARQALSGNLCRCSGYRGVLDAVRRVVGERRSAGADPERTEFEEDAAGPRVPQQAGPGAGGVHASAFASRTTQARYRDAAAHATSYDQVSYEDDGYDDGGRA